MIVYLNRAEALALVAAYRTSARRISIVNSFFGSRAIARIKRSYAKDKVKRSVTDRSEDYYNRMTNITPEKVARFDLSYNYKTYRALPGHLKTLERGEETHDEEADL